MTLTVGLITQVLNIFLGVVGLLLVLRLVLQLFGMRWDHPILLVMVTLTNPVLDVTDRLSGIPTYPSSYRGRGMPRSDMLSTAVALVALWTARTLIVWLLGLVTLVPIWVARPLDNIGGILRYVLSLGFDLYGLALFVRILFSWIRVPYGTGVMRFLYKITEPLLAPIRGALPPMGGIDLSPIIAYFLLSLLQRVVLSMISWVF